MAEMSAQPAPIDVADAETAFVRITIAPNGRVVIPKRLRAAMPLGEDGVVSTSVENGASRLVSPAAALHARFRRAGLSAADCACLALAAQTGRPALTADLLWTGLDHGVALEVLR